MDGRKNRFCKHKQSLKTKSIQEFNGKQEFKAMGPEVRALRSLNAEFQKLEICDLDSLHKSYKLKRAGANPENADGFPRNLDYFKTIKQI